jgi:hypothetical protein
MKAPLLFKEDSLHGESRALNISLRGWIALLVVFTLCILVVVIACRVKDIEQLLPALKDLFLPTVTVIVAFYFATKPNNPNPPSLLNEARRAQMAPTASPNPPAPPAAS